VVARWLLSCCKHVATGLLSCSGWLLLYSKCFRGSKCFNMLLFGSLAARMF